MDNIFVYKKIFILISLLVVASVGLYLFFDKDIEAKVVTAGPVKPPVKLKSPDVKLKATMTDCNKTMAMISVDGGFIKQVDDQIIGRGHVENRGDAAVQFVQVQVLWKGKDGKTIDTDSVFATREAVLKPGEKASFQIARRNYLIRRCSAKVIDWWVVDKSSS